MLLRQPILNDKALLVCGIYMKEYHVHRVMRQFGLYHELPLPVVHTVDRAVHELVEVNYLSFLSHK
jgi:hypothetical protein